MDHTNTNFSHEPHLSFEQRIILELVGLERERIASRERIELAHIELHAEVARAAEIPRAELAGALAPLLRACIPVVASFFEQREEATPSESQDAASPFEDGADLESLTS